MKPTRVKRTRSEKVELQHAAKLVDDSYKEFVERPRCRVCNACFTATSETQNYCGGECALIALERRLRERETAPEVDA